MLVVGLTTISQLQAQDPSTIFHRTFDLKEINSIAFASHANDSVRIEPWVGNQLLIETNVKMLNGRRPLMDHFLEKGRWAFDTTMVGDQLAFSAHDPVRNILTNSGIEIVEVVNIVIYIPETFEPSSANIWARKEE
ncbi:MAG: hypothetical protein AAFN65_01675 [Bacteroidota bacterium]